jgi:hypothetical protein
VTVLPWKAYGSPAKRLAMRYIWYRWKIDGGPLSGWPGYAPSEGI